MPHIAMIDSHCDPFAPCIFVSLSLFMNCFSVRGEGGFGSTGVSESSEAAAKRQKLEGETKAN